MGIYNEKRIEIMCKLVKKIARYQYVELNSLKNTIYMVFYANCTNGGAEKKRFRVIREVKNERDHLIGAECVPRF